MSILDVGNDDGLTYYTTSLNDGELAHEYIQRRGPLPVVTSLAIVHQILRDLLNLEAHQHWVCHMDLESALMTMQNDTFLQLRVYDYELAGTAAKTIKQGCACLVRDCCRLLFLLITGKTYENERLEDFTAIVELPISLRVILKSVLTSSADHSTSTKTLHDEVREAICLQVTLSQARNLHRLLVVDSTAIPRSHLQDLLLEKIPVETVIGPAFQVENNEQTRCYPFAIPATCVATDKPVTLHLLPPSRLLDQTCIASQQPQLWRHDPEKQTHLVPMLGLWDGPDWRFLSELREPGFPLSRLMVDRVSLNPIEVTMVLRQVSAGIKQAAECGAEQVKLDPVNILLCVGYDGPVLSRDLERLLQKRLDAWPKFVVKLRLHQTMQELCEQRLVDTGTLESDEQEINALSARNSQNRSFLCLAAYLLTGEGHIRNISQFPAGLTQQAAGYLRECLDLVLAEAKLPDPDEFIIRFDLLMTETNSVSDTRLIDVTVCAELGESAGFVSDFEEDLIAMDASSDPAKGELRYPINPNLIPQEIDLNTTPNKSSSLPWLALMSAVMVVLGTGIWLIWGESSTASAQAIVKQPTVAPEGSTHTDTALMEAPPPSPRVVQPPEQPVVLVAKASPQLPKAIQPPEQQVGLGAHAIIATLSQPAEPLLSDQPSVSLLAETPPPTSEIVANSPASKTIVEQPAATEPIIIRRAITTPPQEAKLHLGIPVGKHSVAKIPLIAPQEELQTPAPAAVATEHQTASSEPVHEPTSSNPITIRHAIVISPEEIEQFLKQQAAQKMGASTSSLPPTSIPSVVPR